MYRPGQTLRVPGGLDSQISRKSAHKGGRVVSPTYRPLPQEIFLILISVQSVAGRIMSKKNFSDIIGN